MLGYLVDLKKEVKVLNTKVGLLTEGQDSTVDNSSFNLPLLTEDQVQEFEEQLEVEENKNKLVINIYYSCKCNLMRKLIYFIFTYIFLVEQIETNWRIGS